MSLPYTKTESFAVGDKVFPTEIQAIRQCIAEELGTNAAIATDIARAARALIPLLERALEISEK